METVVLQVQERNKAQGIHTLRKGGNIPGVVYGLGMAAQSIQIPKIALRKLFSSGLAGSLIDLQVGTAAPLKVIVQDTQFDPVRDTIIHVDFRKVDLLKKIRTEVPVRFVDVAPAVKDLGGTLMHAIGSVEIECLPDKLVKEIVISIAPLATFDDALRVRDVVLPEGVTIINRPEDVIAMVKPPRTEEELAALDQKVEEDIEAVKVEEKGKEEEEGAVVEEGKEAKKEEKKEA